MTAEREALVAKLAEAEDQATLGDWANRERLIALAALATERQVRQQAEVRLAEREAGEPQPGVELDPDTGEPMADWRDCPRPGCTERFDALSDRCLAYATEQLSAARSALAAIAKRADDADAEADRICEERRKPRGTSKNLSGIAREIGREDDRRRLLRALARELRALTAPAEVPHED